MRRNNFFLLHPKNYHELSLRVTFGTIHLTIICKSPEESICPVAYTLQIIVLYTSLEIVFSSICVVSLMTSISSVLECFSNLTEVFNLVSNVWYVAIVM